MDIQPLVHEARAANVVIDFTDGRLRCFLVGEALPTSADMARQLHARESELRAVYASTAALVWSEVLQAEILVLSESQGEMARSVRRTTKKGKTTWKPAGRQSLATT